MSKTKLLKFKQYYFRTKPGGLSEGPSFVSDQSKGNFSEVVTHLIDRKYIHLTANGDCHLLPKGLFLHEAIVARAKEMMDAEGAHRYRFSSFFSVADGKPVSELTKKFEAQMFDVSGGKISRHTSLKYASDPVLFQYFSRRAVHTPLKVYSPDYFFRAVQTGELKPLINPREFFMTDFHYFCEPSDFDSFLSAAVLNKRAVELFAQPGEWYLNIDTNEYFFDAYRQTLLRMLDTLSINAVINVASEKTHYYSLQFQFMVDYYRGNRTQLANLQFDEKNGPAFGIVSRQSGKSVSI